MPVPSVGFDVTASYVAHLSQGAKEGFRETFALFLETRGLTHTGAELRRLHLTVYGTARQATEDDRAVVAEWLRSRLELDEPEIRPLRDLREDR